MENLVKVNGLILTDNAPKIAVLLNARGFRLKDVSKFLKTRHK